MITSKHYCHKLFVFEMIEAPFSLERDHDSITIIWRCTGSEDHSNFELEMCESGSWKSLSNSITSKTIRKKNLHQGVEYLFRVRSKLKGESVWSPFSDSSQPMSVLPANVKILDAPKFRSNDSQSVTLQWMDGTTREGYKIRFRGESDYNWQHVNSIVRDKVVRKKGLSAGIKYYFSICPVGAVEEFDFSPSSLPFMVSSLSQSLKNLLPKELHTPQWPKLVSTADALAGKVVAIYFSAHWCGPCRSFTPKLAAAHKTMKSEGKNFEVVFCSADHDESEFESYYGQMPFLAIPYNDEKRESFMSLFKVSGIPRLVILSPSGKIIVDNAAGMDISMQMIDNWIERGSQM